MARKKQDTEKTATGPEKLPRNKKGKEFITVGIGA